MNYRNLIILLLVSFVFLPLRSEAISDKLEARVDATLQQITSADEAADNVLNIANNIADLSTSEITATQKDANKAAKGIDRTVRRINKTLTAIRKELKKLRQDPNFNQTDAEIRELDTLLSDLKEQRQALRAKKKEVNRSKSVLPTGIKSLADVEMEVRDSEINCQILEPFVDEFVAGDLTPDDADLLESMKAEFAGAVDTEKKIKKKLNRLFGNLNRTTQIRALQSLLRRIRAVKRKYKPIADLEAPERDFQVINDTQTVGPVTCTLAGELQPSGFGTARVTCEYPAGAQSGLLRYSADRGNLGDTDFGFAARNFSSTESPKLLSIDPCTGNFGLPVCEEAGIVFDAYFKGSFALVVVEMDGQEIGVAVFSVN